MKLRTVGLVVSLRALLAVPAIDASAGASATLIRGGDRRGRGRDIALR